MEAWLGRESSSLLKHPAAALNATAIRWGLAPFPPNLVVAPNANHTYDGWPNDTYYPCGLDDRRICDATPSCRVTSCLILIQNTNHTTVGPANSNIVALAHGLTVFFFLLLTPALLAAIPGSRDTMKVLRRFFKPRPSGPSGPKPRSGPDNTFSHPDLSRADDPFRPEIRQWYDEIPSTRTVRPAEIPLTVSDKAGEVARVSALLRDMYTHEVAWRTKKNSIDPSDKRVVEEMKTKSAALLGEIQRSVAEWDADVEGRGWTEEERVEVAEIRSFLEGLERR